MVKEVQGVWDRIGPQGSNGAPYGQSNLACTTGPVYCRSSISPVPSFLPCLHFPSVLTGRLPLTPGVYGPGAYLTQLNSAVSALHLLTEPVACGQLTCPVRAAHALWHCSNSVVTTCDSSGTN